MSEQQQQRKRKAARARTTVPSGDCRCISYNKPESSQTRPEVVLRPPFGGKTVCVDACIAEAIQALWDAGVVTRGCCCGHGKEGPSVVLDDGVSDDMARTARSVLAEKDGRAWSVLAWRLVDVPEAELSRLEAENRAYAAELRAVGAESKLSALIASVRGWSTRFGLSRWWLVSVPSRALITSTHRWQRQRPNAAGSGLTRSSRP